MEIVDWESAEFVAAIHMRSLGFSDARLTQRGADGGVDVRGTGVGAQVKYYSKPVGAPDVQQIRGAIGVRDRALFYALSGYTKAAVTAADVAQVALFTFDRLGEVAPLNAAAWALTTRRDHHSSDLPIAERSRLVIGIVDRALAHASLFEADAHTVTPTKEEMSADLSAAVNAIKLETRTLAVQVGQIPRAHGGAFMADFSALQARIGGYPRETELRYALSHLAWLADEWGSLQARVAAALGQPVFPIPGGRGERMVQFLRASVSRIP